MHSVNATSPYGLFMKRCCTSRASRSRECAERCGLASARFRTQATLDMLALVLPSLADADRRAKLLDR